MKCVDCGKPCERGGNLCNACDKKQKSVSVSNEYWMEQAESVGLELWERQPHETDTEWATWCAYRKYYPGKQRTKLEIAQEVGIAVATLGTIGRKWNYNIRIRSWATHIDTMIKDTRYNDIMEMNKQHIDMAKRLNAKVSEAIDYVEPSALTPHQLTTLMKMTTEMEKKARVDQLDVHDKKTEIAGVVEAPKQQKEGIKKSEMAEVLGILLSAGAIEQTTTTKLKREEVEVIDQS